MEATSIISTEEAPWRQFDFTNEQSCPHLGTSVASQTALLQVRDQERISLRIGFTLVVDSHNHSQEVVIGLNRNVHPEASNQIPEQGNIFACEAAL